MRLKIIDLEGGDQPIASADGDTVVAFNGEVYNFRELRSELEARGRRFRTRSDTEVVLEAFREWDVECFGRLRGMFGVALWSQSRRRLVLARDRVGIKPLYYCRNGRDICFASELKGILEHEWFPRRINLEGLAYYLALNYVPCPHTLVDGIVKLPPGHWLEWRDGTVRQEPYWKLEMRPRQWDLEDARAELDRLMGEAVREHMISDVPLGIWASGGLDSSTVLHYAAQASSTPLKTFSVSFHGRSFDESPYFRQVAEIYGTDHHEFDLNPEAELADAIERLPYYSDEPSADAGALPVWYLAKMSRRHVTVALAGDGGDELFGGYITYLADRWTQPLRAVPPGMRRGLLRALERLVPVSNDKISLEYKLKRAMAGTLLPRDDAHFFWNGAFGPEQRRAICPAVNGHTPGMLAARVPPNGEGMLNRYMMIDQLYYLPDDILYKVDRMSMAHSLEVRPPLLDHRIVEFAASLPQNFKIRGLTQKFLLKELMRGKLPESILNRKKTGFDIPTHHWFRGPLRDLLMDTLAAPVVESTGIFDARAIHALIRDHMNKRINAGYQLWGLLTLFLWMRRWRIGAAAQPHAEPAAEPAFATN